MKKFLIMFFTACICCGLTANSYSAEFSVSGKVTSLNKGVKGIKVSIDKQIYETDENGYYKADHIQSGTSPEIKIESKDFCSYPSLIKTENVNGDMENMDFIVCGEISGQLTYKGVPMSNAIVTINDRQQKYITDSDGNYKIFNVGLNQEYTVSVFAKGYTIEPKKTILRAVKPKVEVSPATVPATKVTTKKNDIVEPKDILEQRDNVLDFEAKVSRFPVTITVTKGLMPLENVEIIVNNDKKNKFKTDKDGVCKIENLVYGGKYIIKAEKKGVVFADRIQTIKELTREEKIKFEAFLDISGNVTIDNEPFANVIIECGDRKVKTDKNGNYMFKDMKPNKSYEIKAVSSVFNFEPKQITIKSLKNSISENNFKAVADAKDMENKYSAKRKIKLETQKKEAAKVEKEEKAKQKIVDAETKKAQIEEDLKVKEEVLQEQKRIKEKQLKEDREIAEYKAALAAEAEKGKNTAEDTIKGNLSNKNKGQSQQPAKEVKKEEPAEEPAVTEQPTEEEFVTIQGRVMENKYGVADVQIMLIMPPETKKFSTDKNGFYKISGLEKNKNYVVTVLADTKTANLSPKSRIYKELNTSVRNQNFYYIVENNNEDKDTTEEEKK